MNAEILKSYTRSSEALPALVLVNHDKVGPILVKLCNNIVECIRENK